MNETRMDIGHVSFMTSTESSPTASATTISNCEADRTQLEVTMETDNWIPLQQIDTSPLQMRGPSVNRRHQESLWSAYNNEPGHENHKALFEDYHGLAQHTAQQFMNRGAEIDDLRQVADLALWTAIDRFNPNEGAQFTTYATISIRGEIKRYLRDKTWPLKVPRQLQENMLTVWRAANELTYKLGTLPSVSQIADHLKLTRAEVREAQELIHVYHPTSLNVDMTNEESGKLSSLIDRLGEIDSSFCGVENQELLRSAFTSLTSFQKQVIYWIYYERLTQMEIASILGKSQTYVGRELKKALHEMLTKINTPDD